MIAGHGPAGSVLYVVVIPLEPAAAADLVLDQITAPMAAIATPGQVSLPPP